MKTILSAIAVASVVALAGCASSTSGKSGLVGTSAKVDCHWPEGTKYRNDCMAAAPKAPTPSGTTAANWGKRECPWPVGSKNMKHC